jgi:hypothetical protein
MYWDEFKGFGFDHLKSYGIDTKSEKHFLRTVG